MYLETICTDGSTLAELKKAIERLEMDERVTDETLITVYGEEVFVEVED